MKTIGKIILFVLALSIAPCAKSQPSKKTIKERKKIIKQFKKYQSYRIILNDSAEISPSTYINLPDDVVTYCIKNNSLNNSNKNENKILVNTLRYMDSRYSEVRKANVTQFRSNEYESFFGNEKPLIMYGDKEISLEDYYDLPEDSVAFINFYMTDFVKNFYSSKGRNGIIYVCPNTGDKCVDYSNLNIPSENRNYYQGTNLRSTCVFRNSSPIIHDYYIREKLKELGVNNNEKKGIDIKVSCVIHADGKIEPIVVENIKNNGNVKSDEVETYVNKALDIIKAMPKWEESYSEIYNTSKNSYILIMRDASISLDFSF